MDRRRFLASGLMLGCSAAASPLLTPVALASAPWENRLVVIILRGAMDGIDAVQPVGDRDYAGLRPTLSMVEERTELDGFWDIHPALVPLMPLYQAGQMGAVHAVSTPYRDKRSHFDGQDILEAGTVDLSGAAERDGWLNRMLATVPGIMAETAYAIGTERLLILNGQTPVSRWSPDARLSLSPQTRLLLEVIYANDPLFHAASEGALRIMDELEAEEHGDEARLQGAHQQLAQFAASRLRHDSRIASFSLGGWDTHAQQHQALPRALTRLSETILTLQAELGPVWDKTAVICITEFGRTARENGTRGTDHGTGGAMIYAGGALRGRQIAGDWPGLAEADLYAGRDLMPTRDVRAHAAWVMRGLFGLDQSVLENAVFPGLDMGADTRLVL
ncbi:MAG: DUF1501 domain-containing protein [Rhodobacterales bacterium]|nr:DUF1501 domain-containing protein [Rhodobacterales bacterium]